MYHDGSLDKCRDAEAYMVRRFVTLLCFALLTAPLAGGDQTATGPTLVFTEAPSGTFQVANAGSSHVVISLTLENTSTQSATGLRWETPAFAIAGRAKIAGSVNPQPASVARVSVVPIVVDVMLTDVGTYRGLIRL